MNHFFSFFCNRHSFIFLPLQPTSRGLFLPCALYFTIPIFSSRNEEGNVKTSIRAILLVFQNTSWCKMISFGINNYDFQTLRLFRLGLELNYPSIHQTNDSKNYSNCHSSSQIYERNFPIMCKMTTDPTNEREAMRTVVGPIWSPGESSV